MKKETLIIDEIITLFNDESNAFRNNYYESGHDERTALKKIRSMLERTCTRLQDFEKSAGYDQEVLKTARKRFRQETDETILKSYCLNRARTWPQGYQGDYKTLETIYRNTPLSSGMGYYLDLYALNAPLAVGLRNRVSITQAFLKEELRARVKPKILNIACGSCRELMGIAPDIKKANAHITCIDNDGNALNFALSRMSYTGALPYLSFRRYDAVKMSDGERNGKEFGMQDIIYSNGLFDYLSDDLLVALLDELYDLLNTNGKLVFTFKDANYYDATPYRWITDWNALIQRNQFDFLRILSNTRIPADEITGIKDDTRIITFYTVFKSTRPV